VTSSATATLSLHDALPISDGEGRLLLDASGLPGGDQQRHGWAVATWAVLTASETGVSRVTVDNKVWDRSAGDQAHWQNLPADDRSEEHTSELQSRFDLVCR